MVAERTNDKTRAPSQHLSQHTPQGRTGRPGLWTHGTYGRVWPDLQPVRHRRTVIRSGAVSANSPGDEGHLNSGSRELRFQKHLVALRAPAAWKQRTLLSQAPPTNLPLHPDGLQMLVTRGPSSPTRMTAIMSRTSGNERHTRTRSATTIKGSKVEAASTGSGKKEKVGTVWIVS